MKTFECVDKKQHEADPHHADYREIKAGSPNKARHIYSAYTGTPYKNVLCRTKKGYPQWIIKAIK